jgi:hypothetical protein
MHTREHLASVANKLAREMRRGGFPRLTAQSSRETVIDWLQANDPNGIHTDRLAMAEDFDPYTLSSETAWVALGEMLADEL